METETAAQTYDGLSSRSLTKRTGSKSLAKRPSTPRKPKYEFGGPVGALAITAGLPVLCYVVALACNDLSGCPAPSLLQPSTFRLFKLEAEVGWTGFSGLASWEATGAVLAYYLLNAILYRVLPAEVTEGTVLDNGGRLTYRLNSLVSSLTIVAACIAGTISQGARFPVWSFITDNYLQILTANIAIAFAISLFVYVRSFSVVSSKSSTRELVPGACTGNMIYDHYMGRERNPRITLPLLGEIDLKEWCEVRPGLLGWLLLDWAFVVKQYRTFGFVTDSILFVAIVQSLYVVDCWYNESSILTTMDITTDGFGFMLAFGDLVWVPFIYSLQARYLSVYPVSMGPLGLVGVISLLACGFYIFRAANSEKNTFRTNPDDPSVQKLKYIQTKTGSKLLTSGWWGVARHINYLGDWIQSWAYCLPTAIAGYIILPPNSRLTGFGGDFIMADGREVAQGPARGWGMLVTYFYIVYFAVLLIHRDRRDDEKCHRKYGEDWEKYKKIVRYRIIPGIY